MDNRKRDEKNTFVAKREKKNDVIAVQDENSAEWKSSKGSCPRCGSKNKVKLEDRRYTCGYSEDRIGKRRIRQEEIKILAGRKNTILAEAGTALIGRACSVGLSLVFRNKKPIAKNVG
ncbi:MAG: transposase [Spirochaetaceae bacterium]|jgi:ribosomal protein S27AE|nr:transposase [Spirochaetaceae bacterium]